MIENDITHVEHWNSLPVLLKQREHSHSQEQEDPTTKGIFMFTDNEKRIENKRA